MTLDPASIYSALFDRAASHADGSAFRALLGQSSAWLSRTGVTAAIIAADRLQDAQQARVPTPWAVWRGAGINGPSGGMRELSASWWIYSADGEFGLYPILSALEGLYGITARFAIPGGSLSIPFVGVPQPDPEVNDYLGIEVRISYSQRG